MSTIVNIDDLRLLAKRRLPKIFCNSQAPQPPTGFFVSFDVSLLGHWAHEFFVVV